MVGKLHAQWHTSGAEGLPRTGCTTNSGPALPRLGCAAEPSDSGSSAIQLTKKHVQTDIHRQTR